MSRAPPAPVRADRLHEGELVCTRVLELLTHVTGHSDDITFLAGQRVAAPPKLHLTLPATTGSLRAVHDQVMAWLAAVHVSSRDAEAVHHAVVELATNSIEHAYSGAADHRPFVITGALTGLGDLRLVVGDQGEWRPPAPTRYRGLGPQVTEHLVDMLHVHHDAHGTTATMVLRLSRPGRLLTDGELSGTSTGRPAGSGPMLVLDQPFAPRPRIRVDGPVDAATVTEFARAIRTAGSTGTTADMIMSLVQLDHHTLDPDYPPAPAEHQPEGLA